MSINIWDVDQWICWGRGEDGRKLPADVYGNVSASTRTDDYVSLDKALEAAKRNAALGIAFCFTEQDTYVGIDLDDCIDPKRKILKQWAVPISEQFAHCYQEVSPSKTGIKIFCQGSIDDFPRSVVKCGDGSIEVYDRGRFFTVTLRPAGLVSHRETPYAQESLDWLRDKHFPKPEPRVQPSSAGPVDESLVIRLAFDRAVQDSPSGRNTACFGFACQLRDNGVDEAKAMELARLFADQVSGLRDHSFSAGEAEAIVASAYRGRARDPWERSEVQTLPNPAMFEFIDSPGETQQEKSIELGEFPLQEFCDHSPVIRDFCDYYLSVATYHQEQFGLAAALTAVSTLASRKLISDSGFTANLYSVCVAPTASGKEAPRACLKRLMIESENRGLLGGEKFASGVAIARALLTNPVQLFLLDEFGLALQSTSGKYAAAHLREIVEMLLTTFSSSADFWQGKIYADEKNNIEIECPHAVLYATSTPDELWNGITVESVSNGLLGRVLLYTGEYVETNPHKGEPVLSDGLLSWCRAWGDYSPTGDVGETSIGDPDMRVVETTGQARDRLTEHQEAIVRRRKSEDESRAAIWSRCAEKAGRIALCLAASRHHPDEPVAIDIEDAELAVRLANYSTRALFAQVRDSVAVGDYHRQCQRVVQQIRKRRRSGKMTTIRDVYRGLRIRATEANEIIETLCKAGDIEYDGSTGELREWLSGNE